MNYYLGIDIGGTKCAVILGDEQGNVLEKRRFPTTTVTETLESIMAAAYGLRDRENRVAYGLTVAISNVILFILPTYFLMLENTPTHKLRFILHLDSVLTAPLSNPEQMLAIGIFLTVWVAMIVFGAGNKRKKNL